MPDYFIGLISGTSMDGIDAVAASFGDRRMQLHATLAHPYPDALRRALQTAIHKPDACSVDVIGALDRRVGECFRDAALAVLGAGKLAQEDVVAIGSHGQTLRHQPLAEQPFSLQIGDPATIARGTGIQTIADFRRADIAAGGQGAPLVPPFHRWLFGSEQPQVVLNIGGIANITVLPGGDKPVTGFDTGPGNSLLDRWITRHRDMPFDRGGEWSASGSVNVQLLERFLADDYFAKSPPKSTGFEHFNLDWLLAHGVDAYDPADVQATICELTARTVATAIERHASGARKVLVCGGGAHNPDLLQRLSSYLPDAAIESTGQAGLDPDWVEASAFAWLAMRRVRGLPGNLPSVTGASQQVQLGAIHSP